MTAKNNNGERYRVVLSAILIPEHESGDYEYLGVSDDASQAEIKRAYRKMAKKMHPDRGGSEEEFMYLQEVYARIMAGNGTRSTTIKGGRFSMCDMQLFLRNFRAFGYKILYKSKSDEQELEEMRLDLAINRATFSVLGVMFFGGISIPYFINNHRIHTITPILFLIATIICVASTIYQIRSIIEIKHEINRLKSKRRDKTRVMKKIAAQRLRAAMLL